MTNAWTGSPREQMEGVGRSACASMLLHGGSNSIRVQKARGYCSARLHGGGRRVAHGHGVPSTSQHQGQVQHLVSSGRAWGGETISIVNPTTTHRYEEGEVGEIWINSESVAQG